MSTVVRARPVFSSARRTMRMPASSPCAPAEGCSVTRASPVSSARILSSFQASSSAPWDTFSGASGWAAAKPGSRAISSLVRGLCFIVQEPSG